MLRPKHFLRWKDRHIARYSFPATGGVQLQEPPPFTACVQQLGGGTWMLPAAGRPGVWLLVAPAP
jgi:hypothetical protein